MRPNERFLRRVSTARPCKVKPCRTCPNSIDSLLFRTGLAISSVELVGLMTYVAATCVSLGGHMLAQQQHPRVE